MKIVALLGGGDWYDASVDHLLIPENMNLKEMKIKYDNWYNTEFRKTRENYKSFPEYLKENGAIETSNTEIEEFWY